MENGGDLVLPSLQLGGCRFGSNVTDKDVYEAFVDYFYLASVSATLLQHIWMDLLVLATEYEVAALKEQCEQYVEGNVDFNKKNILTILEVGLQCNSEAIVRRAIEANFKNPQSLLLDLGDAPYRLLVQSYPHVDDWMCQAERVQKTRKGAISNPAWIDSLLSFYSKRDDAHL